MDENLGNHPPELLSWAELISSQGDITFDIIDKAFNRSFYDPSEEISEDQPLGDGFQQESEENSNESSDNYDLDKMSEFV